jgi:hypothetical protein
MVAPVREYVLLDVLVKLFLHAIDVFVLAGLSAGHHAEGFALASLLKH